MIYPTQVQVLGATALMMVSLDFMSVISSLPMAHLYSFTRLDNGKERAPFSYSPTLLRHLGKPVHSSVSPIFWHDLVDGDWPYDAGQKIKLKAPGRAVLLILLRPLMLSCLICFTCLESLKPAASQVSHKLLQDCWFWYTNNGESLVGNTAFDDGDAAGDQSGGTSCFSSQISLHRRYR